MALIFNVVPDVEDRRQRQLLRMAAFWASREASKRAADEGAGEVRPAPSSVERLHMCSWCEGQPDHVRLACSAWVPKAMWQDPFFNKYVDGGFWVDGSDRGGVGDEEWQWQLG